MYIHTSGTFENADAPTPPTPVRRGPDMDYLSVSIKYCQRQASPFRLEGLGFTPLMLGFYLAHIGQQDQGGKRDETKKVDGRQSRIGLKYTLDANVSVSWTVIGGNDTSRSSHSNDSTSSSYPKNIGLGHLSSLSDCLLLARTSSPKRLPLTQCRNRPCYKKHNTPNTWHRLSDQSSTDAYPSRHERKRGAMTPKKPRTAEPRWWAQWMQ
ncbi:hypothetical protein V8E55_005146 [Tylopilus felleus]